MRFLAAYAAFGIASGLTLCDTNKIAIETSSTLQLPEATTCASTVLGDGIELSSIFLTTTTSDETINKMSDNASCQAWYGKLSNIFRTSFGSCDYLGRNIQEYGKLTLAEFLQANNNEISNFDPSRTASPTPVDGNTTLTPRVTSAQSDPSTVPPAPATPTPSPGKVENSANRFVVGTSLLAIAVLFHL